MKAMKKLIPAVAMLLVSVVTMSTASFAWFSMSREVTAQGMNVTVSAPTNLQIKHGEGSYGATADATAVGTKLVPASTANGSNFYIVDTKANTSDKIGSDGTLKTGAVLKAGIDTDGAYVDFTYTVKTTGDEDVVVVVKSISIVTADDHTKPVRVAVLEGGSAGTVKGMFNPGGGTNATTGLVNGLESGKTPTYDTTKQYNALTGVNQTNAVTAVTLNSGNNREATFTIRVWYEGQDTLCTTTNGANAQFSVSVILADKSELPASGS